MSADDDDRRLDEQVRALTRRVVGSAPPPIPFEQLGARARARRARAALALAAVVLVVAAVAGALVWGRDEPATTVASAGGEPTSLELRGRTTLTVDGEVLSAVTVAVDGGGEADVAVTADRLCTRAGPEATPLCSARTAPIDLALVVGDAGAIALAAVPADTAFAVIEVEGRSYTQRPLDGLVGFEVPAEAPTFTIRTYDASGVETASLSG